MSEFWQGWFAAWIVNLIFFWFVIRSNNRGWKAIVDRLLAMSKRMLARIEHLEGRLRKRQPDDSADWWKQ